MSRLAACAKMMAVGRLFHFSEDPSIQAFQPRPVRIPSQRPPGLEWLNGPLVWAVSEERQACYCFPRDCPRILLWLTAETTPADRAQWWGGRRSAMIAHIEWHWFERLATTPLFRYELPSESFESVAGHDWVSVSGEPVVPIGMEAIADVPAELRRLGIELRVMESLLPLQDAWDSTLHVSGFRLRNALDWP
jgi:hypothetical protein